VLHIVDPVDAGQLRGVSRFSPALVKLFLLDQYDDAELDRKKVAAMFVGFVRRPERDFDNTAEPMTGASRCCRSSPGNCRSWMTARTSPSRHQPTWVAITSPSSTAPCCRWPPPGLALRQPVGRHAQGQLLQHPSGAARVPPADRSLPALGAGVSAVPRRVGALDGYGRVSGQLALPDYEQRRADYLDCNWLPPRWDWVDPLKDIRAEIPPSRSGFKSRTQAIAERGFDAAMVDAEIASDRDREARLGLAFTRGVPPATPLH
jgi:hypothetical protein